MWILFILVIVIALFFSVFVSIKLRNRRLDLWARSVPLTKVQQDAMWELWQAFKNGQVPEDDPVSRLSKDDREYIKTICGADYRPSKFGSADVLRLAQFQSLMERGYTAEQSAIIVGMTINKIGRKDIEI